MEKKGGLGRRFEMMRKGVERSSRKDERREERKDYSNPLPTCLLPSLFSSF
jgi:hypothetical protein